MVFKTVYPIFYPNTLKNNYNAIITDYRQSQVQTSASDAKIYIFNTKETLDFEENKVTIRMNRINSSGKTIAGYKYITDNTTTQKAVNTANCNLIIPDFRDPNAKIIFYGGGSDGKIISTPLHYSKLVNSNKTLSVNASFKTSINIFSYPNSSGITVTVTPTYSGSPELEDPSNWTHKWDVKFNGATGTVSGNNHHSKGSFTFYCPYDTNWTKNPPQIEVYCSQIIADYEYIHGGQQITTTYFHLDPYYPNPYEGGIWGANGTALIMGENGFKSLGDTFVETGDYKVYSLGGGTHIIECSGEYSEEDEYGNIVYTPYDYVRINSSFGRTYEITETIGGTTYTGTISYNA